MSSYGYFQYTLNIIGFSFRLFYFILISFRLHKKLNITTIKIKME